jgi:tRNA modification GTPase
MADRQDETIVAVATPPGKSGIGIVRLSGGASLAIAQQITRTTPRPRHAHYCTFRDRQGRLIDKGILLFFKAPESYTGEDVVEFHGHGGQAVLNLLLRETVDLGARLAKAGEFTERAYLNDKIDLIQAEAVADLIDSATAQAARSAARSLEGEFSEEISRLLEQLTQVRAYVEAALDFPEEEIDFLKDEELRGRLDQLAAQVDTLLARSRKGRRLREGLRAIIAGRTNVGKSSLLNRLTQTNRAIVTDIAGTTRDVIEDTILIEGAYITIVDSAGIRESADPVEQEGVRRTRDEIEKADLIVAVTDRDDVADGELASLLGHRKIPSEKLIVVHNKIDLFNRPASEDVIDGLRHLYVSAKTGIGIDLLRSALMRAAGLEDTGEGVILARERHVRALELTGLHITTGMKSFKLDGSGELLADELRKAQQVLGEVTGVLYPEDLLAEIFSRFCIGK